MSVRKLDSLAAFVFGLIVASFLHWTSRGRGELTWHEEQYLRDDLCYRLSRYMTWEMAKDIAAKVPRAWL